MYLGDFVEDDSDVVFYWNTNDSNGASITRATDGTVKLLRDDATDCTAGAITDTEDNPDVGIHRCIIDLSGNANCIVAHDYVVWIDGAVIDGQTVNTALAHLSIENRSALRPTTAGRTIDVSATGEAGLDFANIKDAAAHTTIDISVNVALATTLAVRTSDSVFTINAGSAVNDAYNNMVLALYDVTGTLWETRRISDYVGASKTVTVDTAFTFVVAANDVIKIYMNAYAPTVAAGGGATAAQVWAHDVSGNVTQGQAGNYQKITGGRYG